MYFILSNKIVLHCLAENSAHKESHSLCIAPVCMGYHLMSATNAFWFLGPFAVYEHAGKKEQSSLPKWPRLLRLGPHGSVSPAGNTWRDCSTRRQG
ncbi:hypothetical protein GDO78_004151 [Eleutherodactylus coqui]|uniref:Uncharacterized protein n=1 Tax=Eleutherodactylus coqui TaxID=57060 RepID=A0A8J6EQ29_ELECQ|nr:hypothetical protein GDO78_004151 [Eleutherodactylus coqui]